MSEAMALERLTQMVAELEGYLTDTRVPYHRNRTGGGRASKGEQQGDLDVVGLGPMETSDLLVAECKGVGTAFGYESWMKPSKCVEISDLVENLCSNIRQVSHPRWNNEFSSRNQKPDEVWIVFPGHFTPRVNPKSQRGDKIRFWLWKSLMPIAQRGWDEFGHDCGEETEAALLESAEQALSEKFSAMVRLKPVHRLLRELIGKLPADIDIRRKRYPDTALEMFRWIIRTVQANCLDLADLQDEIKQYKPDRR